MQDDIFRTGEFCIVNHASISSDAHKSRMSNRRMKRNLMAVYRALYEAYGPQHWWPAETPFEVMVGAILTQNTSWHNVEKAIRNLKEQGVLSPRRISALPKRRLCRLIRPAGYYNIKALRLKSFLDFFLKRYRGSVEIMSRNSL